MRHRDRNSSSSATLLGDDYEVLEELGRGGMAVVYRARERVTGRELAIKVIHAKYADDEEVISRFAREARTVTQLCHPNIVPTFAIWDLRGRRLAILMPYIRGRTLRQVLRTEGPLSFGRAEQVLHDIAEALRYAHGKGIVHRDVKPENIFLDAESGRALLSDFGVARPMDSDTQLTRTGVAVGTPTYMSPEQIDGAPVDGRSDLYSLGVVGWEMLAGERPWAGNSLYSVIYKQKHEHLPQLRELRPGIPERLLFAIEGALDKHCDTRWADAGEFLAQLLEETPAAPTEMRPATTGTSESTTLELHRPPSLVAEREQRAAFAPAPRRARPLRGRRLALSISVAAGSALAVLMLVTGARGTAGSAPGANRTESATIASRDGEPVPERDRPLDGAATGHGVASAPPSSPPQAAGRAQPAGPIATPTRRNVSAIERTTARTRADSLALCGSPTASAQRACLFANIAQNDRSLNRAYVALIAELRRQARAVAGAAEPKSVQRLRATQRAWLVFRDTECRRRTRGQGPLWAPPRARCFAELSNRRADELTSALARLRTG